MSDNEIGIINSLYVKSNIPLDKKWGPYKSTEDCKQALPGGTTDENSGIVLDGVRYQGLTVGINEDGTIKEYWFKGGTTDDDLVEKTIELPENTDNGLPEGIYVLSFDSNGGTGYMNSILTNTESVLKLPECEFRKENSSFNGWDYNNDIKQPGAKLKLTTNIEIKPKWDTLYKLTVKSNDSSYGSVSGNGLDNGEGWYKTEDKVTITATPNTGYSFVQWKEDGNTDNPRDIIIKRSYIELTAIFEILQYTITVETDNINYGTVYVNEQNVTRYSGKYNTTVNIYAEPKDGCSFIQWNDKNTETSRTITIGGSDKTYTGTFEQNWYIIDGYYSTVDAIDKAIDNNKLETCVFNNKDFVIKPNDTGDFQTEMGNFIIFLPLNMSLSGEYTALSSTTPITIVEENLPDIDNATNVYTKLENKDKYRFDGIDYKMYLFKCGSKSFDKYTIKIDKKQQ